MNNSATTKIALLLCMLLALMSWAQSQETKSEAAADKQVKSEQPVAPATVAQPELPADAKAASNLPPEKPLRLSGDATVRYRLQANEDETDQNFYGVLQFQVDNIVPDKVSFSFYGMGLWDVGGDQYKAHNQTDWYRDVYDSYVTSAQGRLYHAYLTLDNWVMPDTTFIIGRQTRYIDQGYDFDGGYGEIRLFKDILKLSAFGGASVYHFKGPRGGDWMAGGGAEISPIPITKFSVDFVYVAEDSHQEGRDDYELIFRLKQKVWKNGFLSGQLVVLNDDVKDVSVTANASFPRLSNKIKFRFYALVNELNDLTSTYSRFLGAYKPYQQYDVSVSQNLGDYFVLSGGYTARVLDHTRDEGNYNRQFERFHVTFAAEGWPFEHLDASVSFKRWVTDDNSVRENDMWGIDAELGYAFNEQLKGSVGVCYELFKYEEFNWQPRERVGVTTAYTKLKYQATEMFSCFGEFGWEYDEARDFYNVELGVQAKF